MNPKPIVIVGAGGFGREVLGLVRDINSSTASTPWEVKGFLDSATPNEDLLKRLRVDYLGSNKDQRLVAKLRGCYFVVAIGSPQVRQEVYHQLLEAGLESATLVHPTALIGDDVLVDHGVVVCAGSVITTNIRIGQGAQVNLLCTIGHDSSLDEFATLAPGVSISGNCLIGAGAYLGTRCSTIQGVSVGNGAIVGAGAVVTQDVAPRSTVVGVPAKQIKQS